MEKRVAKVCSLILMMGLFVLPLVSAEGFFTKNIGVGFPGDLLDTVFGLGQISTAQTFFIYLAIFLIIFVASSDILQTFTTFSPMVSWVIGFALAIIVAVSGATASLALFVFGAVAAFGAIAIAIVIGSGFFVALVVHLGLSGLSEWIQKRNIMMRAAKGEATAEAGLRTLKGVGKEAAK